MMVLEKARWCCETREMDEKRPDSATGMDLFERVVSSNSPVSIRRLVLFESREARHIRRTMGPGQGKVIAATFKLV